MGDLLDRDELTVFTQVLKLPPDRCPPNHYELLNIARDEIDGKKIEAAARKQITRLRGNISPDLLRAARLVLKRIQRAQTCLQEPRARAAYDFSLDGDSSKTSTASIWDELDTAQIPLSSPTPVPAGVRAPSKVSVPKLGSVQGADTSKTLKRSNGTLFLLAGAIATAVTIVAGIIVWMHVDKKETVTLQAHITPNAISQEKLDSDANVVTPSIRTPSDHESNLKVADAIASPAKHDLNTNAHEVSLERKVIKNEPAVARSASTDSASLADSGMRTNLPEAIDLPPQREVDSELAPTSNADAEALEIGTVSALGAIITIDGPYVMSGPIRFEASNAQTNTGRTFWDIKMRSTVQDQEKDKSSFDEIAAGIDEAIAKVSLEGGSLKFTWTNSKYPQLSDELRNCVLCIEVGDQRYRIQLRKFQDIPRIVLNFEQGVTTFNLEGEHLPAPDSMFIAVRPGQTLMKNVSMDPEDGRVAVNKIVTLKVPSDDKQQVEIRVTLKKTSSKYIVAIGPRYRMGANWQPFTTDRINTGLKGLQDALLRQQDSLSDARKSLPSISSSLSSAQSRLNSTNDAMQRHLLQVQVHGLQTRVNREQQLIERKERETPELQGDITTMKKLVELGNRLRSYTELGIRVGVKTTNGEFDLLRSE